MWSKKTDNAKLNANPPTLKSLPPTDEALELNIKRAYYQAMLWQNSVYGIPPDKDPCKVLSANVIAIIVHVVIRQLLFFFSKKSLF